MPRPRVHFAVAVTGKLHDAQVNAENVLGLNGWRGRQVHRNIQVERAVPQNEVGLPFGAVEPRRLVRAVAHRDRFAPVKTHKRLYKKQSGRLKPGD